MRVILSARGQFTSDALGVEEGTAFEIQIAGERIYIPPHPVIEFDYERVEDEEEVEIELKWKRKVRTKRSWVIE
jgi:hypothetical protein